MPRLLIDARMVRGTLHGIARYCYELVLRTARARPDWTIGVWTRQADFWQPFRAELPNLVPCPLLARPFSLREQWELPWTAARFRPDLIHFTSIAVPAWGSRGSLITIFDLIPYHYPPTAVHRFYLSQVFSRLARRSSCVLCASRSTARDLEKLLRIPKAQIELFTLGGLEGSPPASRAVSERPYFFCVANPKPHKNLAVLLEAYRGLEDRADLVLLSPDAPWLQQALLGRATIRRLHGVSDAELGQLYAGSLATVIPSLCEGFGLPALEAMQLGAAVISSNASSLPEVVGEAGLQFDPTQPRQLHQQMTRLLDEPELRSQLQGRGQRQAQLFSWEECLRGHLDLYEREFSSLVPGTS